MAEHFEWIEPQEVTKERREANRSSNLQMCRLYWRWGSALAVPASLIALSLHLEPLETVALIARMLLGVFTYPLGIGLSMRWTTRLQNARPEHTLILSRENRSLWKHVRSFEISDYPTLPGIRCITVIRQTSPYKAQNCFRIGQVDETELRHFLEARIAEQRTQRLMRRVERKL